MQPQLIGEKHDNIIKRYLDTEEAVLIGRDHLLLGKNKYGYIFPFSINIKPVYITQKNTVDFIAIC